MLFELLLNGMDRFLKLRDTEMEMVRNAANAFRDRCILLSDAAHVRPKTFSIDSCVHLQACKNHTVPYGTDLLGWRSPRHFVPGYDRIVPPGHFKQDLAVWRWQRVETLS